MFVYIILMYIYCRCHFKGHKCDLDKDFLWQTTDYGICYTFNPGRGRRLKHSTAAGIFTHWL